MGLGPPVCENCLVLYEFKHGHGWVCPFCQKNSENCLYAWSCGISVEVLEGNHKLLSFLKKVENHER